MQIVETYSHKGGEAFIKRERAAELQEIQEAVAACNAVECLSKISKEKTKPPLLFSPVVMNLQLKKFLCPLGWTEPNPKSAKGFKEPRIKLGKREFREMDGIKSKVGLEVQFGRYAFMGYDIFAKMPIFANKGLIDCGIELVVMHSMVPDMSTGGSSFQQIRLDMENRGVADIDLPTLVIGIAPTAEEATECVAKRLRFRKDRLHMLDSGEVSAGFAGNAPGPKGDGLFEEIEELEEEAADEAAEEIGESDED